MARTGARASTARVFVFDERLGAREGDEGEKVLAFFPSGTSANDMASAIGLVEGVAGFVSPFAPVPSGPSPDAPLAQTLRTSRRRVACRRCEPGVWWALSLDADAAPERAVRDEALQSSSRARTPTSSSSTAASSASSTTPATTPRASRSPRSSPTSASA